MATISKFYLHDAATTNTGTMPTGAFVNDAVTGNSGDITGDVTGARTARKADDVIGASQIAATFTSNADQTTQQWGYRRFVSSPLAAHTFAAADGNWTFSYARSESNLLHNQQVRLNIYVWTPGSGTQNGTGSASFQTGSEPTVAATEQWEQITAVFSSGSVTGLNGDILVFEVYDLFAQGMATAYTSSFFYDGTTETSTTSCASFVTPPAALTLFTAPVPATPLPLHQSIPFYPRASRPS